MTLRASELLLVADEIARSLVGAPVQKVADAGADGHSLAIGFPSRWLVIAVGRTTGRIHLSDDKPQGTGEAASPFSMQLRKELIGLRLVAVESVAGERACALAFARGEVRRRLVVLLYGGGARITLTDVADGEAERAIGTLPQGATPVLELPPPRAENKPSRFPAEGISRHIDAFYRDSEQDQAVGGEKQAAATLQRRLIVKLRRREEALAGDLVRVAAAADRRKHADLLLAHLAEIPRGAASVTLPDDFVDGEPVTIPLDPSLGPQENVARLYKEHKRLARGRATVEARLADTQRERQAAEERLAAIEAATPETLAALVIRADTTPQPARTPTRAAPQRRALSYRIFRSATGTEIFVGKGADKNDDLTFKVARGNDLWLHTRDFPGAHVVVPLAGRPVDEATLLDAATLAVWFSPARPAEGPGAPGGDEAARKTQADVTYALRKLVRKPRNAPPGRVSVAGGKTIRVRLEPDRLRRLLASRVDA